jgi:hypothetical protein
VTAREQLNQAIGMSAGALLFVLVVIVNLLECAP